MKKSLLILIIAVIVTLLIVGLILYIYINSSSQKNKYTCPNAKTINCMPHPDSTGSNNLCGGLYHDWIEKNCNVIFAY
jgi:flagellar basal body-associated protein FliL